MIRSSSGAKTGSTSGAAAVEIDYDMNDRRQYVIQAKGAALWFKVIKKGDSGPTVGGDDCHYLLPGAPPMPVAVMGTGANARTRVAIIRDGGTDASGCISELATIVNVSG